MKKIVLFTALVLSLQTIAASTNNLSTPLQLCSEVSFITGPGSQAAKREDSTQVTITINPKKVYQTIHDIGGNYCQATYSAHAQDAVGEYTLTHLKPSYVRFPIPLKKWEPENDNADAQNTNNGKFIHSGVMKELFELLREMKTKRGVINFSAAVWDTPDWMVSNPEKREKRTIPPAMYPEVIESITAFLLTARDQYGVSVDYFSFNEADGGYQLYFSPQAIIDFVKLAGPHFEKAGLKTKFLTGDVHRTEALVDYATPMLEEKSIRPYLGPVSYHSWWSDTAPDSVFTNIARLAQQYNLPVWCTEVGYDAFLWKNPEANATWNNAWELAKVMHRVLKYSQASVTHYWTFQNNFPIASPEGKPYPIFYVHKQLADHLPTGSQVIDAFSSDTAVWTIAAKGANNHFMTQIINTSAYPKTVTLQGLPKKEMTLLRTSATENLQEVGQYNLRNKKLILLVPPQSISTLTTRTTENDKNTDAGN